MSFLSSVLTTDMHRNTIRFAPPLIISESQVDSAVDSLTEVVEESLHRLSSAAGRNLWLEHHRENEAGSDKANGSAAVASSAPEISRVTSNLESAFRTTTGASAKVLAAMQGGQSPIRRTPRKLRLSLTQSVDLTAARRSPRDIWPFWRSA